MSSGIYLILNVITLKFYLGSSNHIKNRIANHFKSLNAGNHHCAHLQRSWSKYGEEAFVAILHHKVNENSLKEVEQRYLSFYFAEFRHKIYNSSPCASGGYIAGELPNRDDIHRRSAETRKGQLSPHAGLTYEERYGSLRAAEIQTKLKDETTGRDRHGDKNPFFGRLHSAEFKSKQSERMIGVEPWNKGKAIPGRKCEIDGIKYQSISLASRQIGMTLRKTITRLESPDFPNFKYYD